MTYFFLFLAFFYFPALLPAAETGHRLKIHLFCEANGKGLEKDRNILREELLKLNCQVTCFDSSTKGSLPFADINIFVQAIHLDYLNSALHNWFIPNPEWFLEKIEMLNSIDLVLCKTKETEKIFKNLRAPTYFLGFTSKDQYRKEIKRNPSHYFHLAGSNSQKGTGAIQKVWLRSAHLPFLTAICRNRSPRKSRNFLNINAYLSENELLQLQNECMVHLCPSETEGFGHYIMEAMSVGAVVMTTNAPPMNEFVQDPRFLLSYNETKIQRLATNYYVDELGLERKLWQLQRLTKADLEAAGAVNRAKYLQLTKEFKENLRVLIESVPDLN
ncbi:MAG TPA: glycosyltransferase [Parachlamydiaceae bacterium]|nr:glycosyltransferase [Parachlamydiaceae bacterium]